MDFINQVLYRSLLEKRQGTELVDDFKSQATIELDPVSYGFSNIISDLIPVLEGFDQDPEESIFTEEEFREIIENAAIKLKKYSIE